MPEIVCKKCGKTCKSLQGWKQHCSSAHGGYDDTDLADITGGGGGSEANVRERMSAFASTLGGGESPQTAGASRESASSPVSPPPSVDTTRRVKATPKKLKKVLAGIPAKILETTGIQLDSDDNDALDEAGEFLGDIFGVEFSVPEEKVTVQSRWWAILWVAGVAGLVYIKHRFPEVWKAVFSALKKDGDGKDETASTETEQAAAAAGD